MKKMTEKATMTLMMKSAKYENQISWDLTMAIWIDNGDNNENDWWSWYDLVTIIMAIIIIIIMTKIMTIIMTMIKIWQQDNSVKKNDNDHDMTARPCAPYGKPFYLWYIHWLTLKLFWWWWWYHDNSDMDDNGDDHDNLCEYEVDDDDSHELFLMFLEMMTYIEIDLIIIK